MAFCAQNESETETRSLDWIIPDCRMVEMASEVVWLHKYGLFTKLLSLQDHLSRDESDILNHNILKKCIHITSGLFQLGEHSQIKIKQEF